MLNRLTVKARLYRNTSFMTQFSFTSIQAALVTPVEYSNPVLMNWPGEYRFKINLLISSIVSNVEYQSKVNMQLVDSIEWQQYLNKFRREFIKQPLDLLDSLETFEIIKNELDKIPRTAFENYDEYGKLPIEIFNQKDIKQLDESIAIIFEIILKYVCEEFKNSVAARKVLTLTSDLRMPHEWYPFTRLMKRKIIFHGGPTNSGKTYHALKRLSEADKNHGGGLYCGPLRLLALEVYERLNRDGIYTSLMTGQEKKIVPFETHCSCTIEMVALDREYDIAVVDEIQMISDSERGHAWTRALLGLQAREIHVCGGLEAEQIIQNLCQVTGDDLQIKHYNRLSELKILDTSLMGDYKKIRPGDCIVAFSKLDIFSIKREIEKYTKYRCAVIYGQLPPETRSAQARLFNENNSGFDVLVASDAIGMGLNLNIRRIIFHSTVKGMKRSVEWIHPTLVKQIAGRAGRASSNYKIGEVTTWQEIDLAYVKAVMTLDISPIKSAGLFPTTEQIDSFSEALTKAAYSLTQQDVKTVDKKQENNHLNDDIDHEKEEILPQVAVESMQLSMIFQKFVSSSQTDNRFFICDYEKLTIISNWLHTIPLSITDRYKFATAPVNTRDEMSMTRLYYYAAHYAQGKPVPLHVRLSTNLPRDVEAFSWLCIQHSVLSMYLWLSLRFPKSFIEKETCEQQMIFASKQIESALSAGSIYSGDYSHSTTYVQNAQKRTQLPPLEFGGCELQEKVRKFLSVIPKEKLFKFDSNLINDPEKRNK